MFPLLNVQGVCPDICCGVLACGVLTERFSTAPFSHHGHENQSLYSTARTGAIARPGETSRGVGQGRSGGLSHSSRFNFRLPQCVSLRSDLNTRSLPWFIARNIPTRACSNVPFFSDRISSPLNWLAYKMRRAACVSSSRPKLAPAPDRQSSRGHFLQFSIAVRPNFGPEFTGPK
jgi:hypothetical protein